MKKICILTSVHGAFDVRIFHKEAKTLLQAGYKVTLIAQNDNNEVVDEIKIIALPKPINRFARIFGLPWRVLRLALYQCADIYHFHDSELILIGILLKISGKKVIYDVHEDLPQQIMSKYWMPYWIRPFIGLLAKFIELIGAFGFDGIIAATPYIAKKFPKDKTIIVQNFPLISEYNHYNKPQSFKNREPVIIYIGGVSVIRGAREMIKAIALIPKALKVQLILAGEISPLSLESELRKIKGWELINYIGWQSREGFKKILMKAKVGLAILHPTGNNINSYSVKLFEYMSAGIPIVGSDFPLWRKIVQDNGCGLLVNPLDVRVISKAIRWLLEHPQEAEEMGKRGRELIRKKYNWDREAKKLLDFYKKILK